MSQSWAKHAFYTIMLAIYADIMLNALPPYYAQNYTGIIGSSLSVERGLVIIIAIKWDQ